ncbi:hypothetical protein NPX13_g10724 [Xylaria arbuscula]|uniref:C3H1-type domain-containing protein n=1 Tax=Xylaria arbuscula TaxID=114810 RepID=A0A9W8N455_9PEZI|nr:hypothetical protein NPX13_g10724 [Xylaria arbuscula]
MLRSFLGSSLVPLLALGSALFASSSWASPIVERQSASWPYGPFTVLGAEMKDSRNATIVYAGTNWPGHGEVMIPDGLQYQSIQTIVSKIKSLGMNSIRLTYAIQMVDQYYSNGNKDTTVQQSFITALGSTNGPKVYAKFLAANPSFNANTTRLDVFDAVAAECAKQLVDSTDIHVIAQRAALTRQQPHAEVAVVQLARLVHVRETGQQRNPQRQPRYPRIPLRPRLRHVDYPRFPGDSDDAGEREIQRRRFPGLREQAGARGAQLQQRRDELLEPAELAVQQRVHGHAQGRRQNGECFPGGADCRFEHPGANTNSNPFGAPNTNRFNALSNTSSRPGDDTNPYKITKDAIRTDLASERPTWILSCYGPGKDAPEQLFGGYPREQSLEEVMVYIRRAANQQQAVGLSHSCLLSRDFVTN